MRIQSIQSKVLLLFILLTAVLLLTMSLMVRTGFKQQFDAFKKDQADRLNQSVITTLVAYYHEVGNWNELADNPRLWSQLLVQSATDQIVDENYRRPRGKKKHPAPPRETAGMRRLVPQFSLLDAQKSAIVGKLHHPIRRYKQHPININDSVVGYLLTAKPAQTNGFDDPKLSHGIEVFLWTLAAVMLVITVMATWPIARYFSKPIKLINNATQQAAAGDYSVRAEINRSDELGQLGQNFNLLTSTLQSNADIQKKMMADIAHELRTPVAVMQAQIEAIQDGIHLADGKSLNLLHQQVLSLGRLIQDLHQLSISDLGSMQYQMQAVEIKPIIESAFATQQLVAAEKGLTMKVCTQGLKKHAKVVGDGARLLQMLTNLLANSVAYTDSGGSITLSCSEDEKKDTIVVTIEDSEPGLLPHEMAQMFDRLYRHEASRNKQSGGSGLGLAIVKNIVEAHNGSIDAKQSVLGGICMTLRLPKHV